MCAPLAMAYSSLSVKELAGAFRLWSFFLVFFRRWLLGLSCFDAFEAQGYV